MKSIFKILMCVVCGVGVLSCEIDNYDSPDAQFYGTIIDENTNEPIQQDLIEGSRIDIVELGYQNPNTRQIRFHSDGTFKEANLFTGQYEVQALRGNFMLVEKDTIDINGDTEYNILTQPYLRIENTEISFDSIKGIVTALFNIEQVSGNPIEYVSLMADLNSNVSNTMRAAMVKQDINAIVSSDQLFRLQMSTENLVSGKDYFFRIGALISGISQAKHNYSVPVKLNIDNSHVVPDIAIPGNVIDDCESLDGWQSGGFELSLDTDKKEGEYSLKATGTGVVIIQKIFSEPFNTGVSKENGYLAFNMYVENTAVFGDSDNQFELTSSGGPDVHEISWKFKDMNLFNGWNKVELSLAGATDLDLSAVNFIRFYHTGITGPITVKFDNIRFYEK